MSTANRPASRWEILLLGVFATLMLVPVTLPVPVLRSLVQERFQVSTFETSVFMSINMVGAFLAAPLAGALADRYGRRKTLIVLALLVDSACFFAIAIVQSYEVLLAVRFAEGCAHIFALSLLLSLAAEHARSAGSGRIMGIVGSGITLGVAIGAPLGGMLGRDGHPLMPIYVGAVLLFVVAVFVVLALRDVAMSSRRPGFGAILRTARQDKELLVPLAFAFADRFTVGFFTTTFPLFMKEVYQLPVQRIGILLGMFMGAFFLLSYPFGRLAERTSRTLLICGGSLAYGIGVMTLGSWSVDALPWLMLMLGVLSAVMFVPSLMMTTDLAAPEIKSLALGGFNAAGSLGFIVGPLVGGWVSQTVAAEHGWATGFQSAFLVAGASEVLCVLVTAPILLWLVRAGRTT